MKAFSESTQIASPQDSWMLMGETAQNDQKKEMEENPIPKQISWSGRKDISVPQ